MRCSRHARSAWERAATLALECGQPALAVEWARAAHRAEPLREVAALALVRALAAAGDPAAALATLASYRRRLAEELGVDPSPAAAELQQQLLRSEAAPSGSASPEPSGFDELAFVGRDAELACIRRRLRAGERARRWSPSPAGRARVSPGCWPRSPVPARPSPSGRSGPTGRSPGHWDALCSASSRRPTSRQWTPCPTSCGAALATVLPDLASGTVRPGPGEQARARPGGGRPADRRTGSAAGDGR